MKNQVKKYSLWLLLPSEKPLRAFPFVIRIITRIINKVRIKFESISKLKEIQSSFINFFRVEVLQIELLAYLGCFE